MRTLLGGTVLTVGIGDHMAGEYGVGLIGVNASRGWARASHVPAIQGLRGLRLAAVATRSQDSADAAARAFGVERAYGDAAALIADQTVDVVAVATSVPAHHDLITAAVHAGKHVLTEWPVGVDSAQVAQIKQVTASTSAHVAVGLQARLNPAVSRLRRLMERSAIGPVRNATIYSSTAAFGSRLSPSEVALEDPAAGMNLVTIQLAHTVDLVEVLLGQLGDITAEFRTQYPRPHVDGTDQRLQRSLPDHVLLQGRAGGTPVAVEVVGGRPPDDCPFRLELHGEEGRLDLRGGHARGFQAGSMRLARNGHPVDIEGGETTDLPESAVNTAGVYAALRDDIDSGTETAPSLNEAARLTRLLDAVRDAANGS
ncbi:Gfo/Idh/MocA family oxidoreductase [Asanoa sp. WMMD1127]|uniref:Gfo/Idh/MocA family protein n=1 Tax=Asanoa sp. WMMD1127 TaxID=3016107 RepID=UPI002416991F|nr:Gfo/Idh/MocA family oxidoreductase [Asanoa sp. WMMD1127]MDG4821717.1 Gfo/Idh/MocA family oxidoreductase [Asanoa sp. WMMD1127]